MFYDLNVYINTSFNGGIVHINAWFIGGDSGYAYIKASSKVALYAVMVALLTVVKNEPLNFHIIGSFLKSSKVLSSFPSYFKFCLICTSLGHFAFLYYT